MNARCLDHRRPDAVLGHKTMMIDDHDLPFRQDVDGARVLHVREAEKAEILLLEEAAGPGLLTSTE